MNNLTGKQVFNMSVSRSPKLNLSHIIVLILLVSLIGCDSMSGINDSFSGRRVDYKKQSRSIDRLEMPPDLISNETEDALQIPEVAQQSVKASDYQQTVGSRTNNHPVIVNTRHKRLTASVPLQQQVLPQQDNIELLKEGNVRYLRIHAPRQEIWNKMREFWINKGILIKRESPATGILETEWAENRADIPQDPIRNTLGKYLGSLYSAATRDKYRVRLEATADPDVTELYITHYGMKEVLEGNEGDRTIWVVRPRDPELEIEMLGSMMVYFGVQAQKAKTLLALHQQKKKDKAVLSRNGKGIAQLVIKQTFPRAWRRTGAALDRISFVVEDRDRSKGIYYVQYADPLADETKGGWFSKLKFWGDDHSVKRKYQIHLSAYQKDYTLAQVLDEKGGILSSDTAYRILNLLYEQLK